MYEDNFESLENLIDQQSLSVNQKKYFKSLYDCLLLDGFSFIEARKRILDIIKCYVTIKCSSS